MFYSGPYALAMGLALALGTSIGARAVGQAPEPVREDTAAPNETPGGSSNPIQMGYDSERGRRLYESNCSACHGSDGEGRPGAFPPLKGSGVVTKDDATKHIQVVLNGLRGARSGGVLYVSPMPPFAGALDDADLRDIIDYERSSWGNHGILVTAGQVAAERRRSR
jgi:mono/diheme cytochrome c family protein